MNETNEAANTETTPATPPVEVKPRRFIFDEHSGRPLSEMVRLAPKNDIVRALILQKFRKMPPPEADTFDAIRDWVDANCEAPKTLQHQVAGPRRDADLSFDVTFSEVERGDCRYRRHLTGDGTFVFDEQELLDAVAEHDDVDDLTERLKDIVHEEAYNRVDPSMDYDDNYSVEHYDYESADSDGVDVDIDQSAEHIRRAVVNWMMQNCDAETLERYGL